MKILLTGVTGQLGWEMQRCAPPGIELLAPLRAQLDLAGEDVMQRALALAPEVIVNAGAYTAVDRAESETGLAFAVNARGAGALARAARTLGARLLQVSTDFVFDGSAARAYAPDHPTGAVGAYGASKEEGERRVREALPEATIVRTAWVYSAHGANFVKTMLRLMGSRERLGVVADQVGTPTWTRTLAGALWELVREPAPGATLHWTDLGVASWYDFAVAIQEEALVHGMLERAIAIDPIRSEDYPTPARRPAWSVLDKTATLARLAAPRFHWRAALRGMLDDLQAQA